MALPGGTKLGPYELAEPLGAGGMGEVYRARDARLGRDVAIKIIPAALAGDAGRLRRFEQEARAAAALNHPNILAVYDVGHQDGSPYIVSERLEGETLRERLGGGRLPVRKVIVYAQQIARGLAAAHDKGILHRDVKPENIFVTRDGQVKILDFGLAKLTDHAGSPKDVTRSINESETGTVLGTVGYMSPEQVRGKMADARSDLFSLGVTLYEMLSGQRAFHGETPADTMTAILSQEPPELTSTNRNVTPALERIVRHCLEKNPEERFQSARDLAFDLETISTSSSASLPPLRVAMLKRWMRAGAIIGLVLVAVAATALLALRPEPPPSYQRLTFQRGVIHSARFAPDGQSVIYGAEWQGDPTELFSTVGVTSESRPVGLKDTDLLAVSRSGEMAVTISRNFSCAPCRSVLLGTLARVSSAGGLPREVLEGVRGADWGPDGNLAVVHKVVGRYRLEYPIGHVLYETSGAVSDIRFSHSGKLIAFMDHPAATDDGGTVAFVDLAGKKKTISQMAGSERGLAWSPDDREVWYTALTEAGATSLYASTPGGRRRLVLSVPGQLTLHDISSDGRVLLAQGSNRFGISLSAVGESTQRDLSWLDFTLPADLSGDGKLVLFTEEGEGAGNGYAVYVRKMDASPAVRLGEGQAMALSPDGKWAMAFANYLSSHPEPVLLPLHSGESVKLPTGALRFSDAAFLPDGKRLLVLANMPGHALRLYLQDIADGATKPISEEGLTSISVTLGVKCISPDGRFVVLRGPDGRSKMYPIEGGEPQLISGLSDRDSPIRFTADGRHLFLSSRDEHGARKLERFEIATGRRTPLPFPAFDMTGIVSNVPSQMTADGKTAVYGYHRVLEDLYVVSGLK